MDHKCEWHVHKFASCANATRWVAKTKSGVTIQITDRGRADKTRDALIADGLIIPAAQPRGEILDDLPLRPLIYIGTYVTSLD